MTQAPFRRRFATVALSLAASILLPPTAQAQPADAFCESYTKLDELQRAFKVDGVESVPVGFRELAISAAAKIPVAWEEVAAGSENPEVRAQAAKLKKGYARLYTGTLKPLKKGKTDNGSFDLLKKWKYAEEGKRLTKQLKVFDDTRDSLRAERDERCEQPQ
jgi:hypothetical protein